MCALGRQRSATMRWMLDSGVHLLLCIARTIYNNGPRTTAHRWWMKMACVIYQVKKKNPFRNLLSFEHRKKTKMFHLGNASTMSRAVVEVKFVKSQSFSLTAFAPFSTFDFFLGVVQLSATCQLTE